MTISDTAVIPGLHSTLFSVTRALQKGIKVTSEGESLILKKNPTDICVDKKMEKHGGKGFLLAIKFNRNTNNAALLVPEKRNPEGEASVHPEGMTVEKREQKTTEQQATQKIRVKELRAKLGSPIEDRICATVKHIHYSIKGMIQVYEDSAIVKSKHKFLHKVAEERDLKPGETIYLDISSQKRSSYGGYKNWILIQDSGTRKNYLSL